MRQRKRLYTACKYLIGLLLIISTLACAGVLWLQAAPRDVTHLAPRLVGLLLPKQAALQLELGRMQIVWRKWREPLAIQVEGLRLKNITSKAQFYTTLASIDIDLSRLLLGQWEIEQLTLYRPKLRVARDKDAFSLTDDSGANIANLQWNKAGANYLQSLPVKRLHMQQADVSVLDKHRKISYALFNADLSVFAEEQLLRVEMQALGQYRRHEVPISGGIKLNLQTLNAEALLNFQGFNPNWLCDELMECEGLPTLDGEFFGTIGLNYNAKGAQDEWLFDLRAKEGRWEFQPHFPETLNAENVQLRGRMISHEKLLNLDQLDMVFGDTKITASGELQQEEKGVRVVLHAEAKRMPVTDLGKYWPATLAPNSRQWAIDALKGGMATHAKVDIHIVPDDMALEFLPDAFLQADIALEDTILLFIEGFPEATGVKADVRFTGQTLTAEIHEASVLKDTRITSAKIHLPDLNHPNTPVEIDLALDTTADDATSFLKTQPFNPLKRLPALDASKAKGQLDLALKLGFDAYREEQSSATKDGIDWDRVSYGIKGSTKALTGLTYAGYRLDSLAATFDVDAQKADAQFTAQMKDSLFEAKINNTAEAGLITLKASLSTALLALFHERASEWIGGAIPLTLKATRQKQSPWQLTAEADMRRESLSFPMLGIDKPGGVPAKLTAQGGLNAGKPIDWRIEAKDIKANGQLQFNDDWQIKALNISQFVTPFQDFSASYQPQFEGIKIEMNAKKLQQFALDEETQSNEDKGVSLSTFPSMAITADIKQFTSQSGIVISPLQIRLDCIGGFCRHADMTAEINRKPAFALRINPATATEPRRFYLLAEPASALFSSLDIADGMRNGLLEIKGEYDDSSTLRSLNARVLLTHFQLKDAPILGRILNLGSLSGMVETLSGEGIGFDKFSTSLHFANDIATLKDARAAGSAIGILLDGTVDIKQSELNLNGSLAPVYAINSLLAKVPLVGEMLAGGAGAGIIAFNFSVKGDADNPDVMVNPLSALTPGFLRGFFDMMDTPAPKAEGEPVPPAPPISGETGLKPLKPQ